MNGRLLLDTNVIIGYLLAKEALLGFLKAHADAELFVSVISKLELLSFHGLSNEDEDVFQSFLSNVTLIPLNEEVQSAAIAFRRVTRRKLPDAIVAASAIQVGAILATCDRELAASRFPGFKTVNPDYFQQEK